MTSSYPKTSFFVRPQEIDKTAFLVPENAVCVWADEAKKAQLP